MNSGHCERAEVAIIGAAQNIDIVFGEIDR